MAKLPSIKKILKEDLKDSPIWVDKMLYVLNRFMEEIYGALNRDLTFTDNIASSFKSISISTYANYPTSFDTMKIANPLRTNPTGVILIRSINSDNNSPIKSAIGIDWDFLDGNIRILHVSGLAASTNYQLSFLII